MEGLDSVFYKYGKTISHEVEYGAEFVSIPTGKNNELLIKGQFYSYQDQLTRATQYLDSAVCLYMPGTGKTHTYIKIASSLHLQRKTGNEYLDQYITTGKAYIERVVIATSNQDLADAVKLQLTNYYKLEGYNTNTIDIFYKITSHQTLKNELYKIFDEKYSKLKAPFSPFGEFCNYLDKQYSNTLFLFDESAEIAGEQISHLNFKFLEEGRNYRTIKGVEGVEEYRKILNNIYHMLHLCCHVGTNIKRMAFTGTIMKNSAEEFITTFNLVLPTDRQISYRENLETWNALEFDKWFSDIIFYIKHPEEIKIKYMGNVKSEKLGYNFQECLILKDSPQEKCYLKYQKDEKEKESLVEVEYCTHLVFDSNRYFMKDDIQNNDYMNKLRDSKQLARYGCKVHTFRRIIEHYQEKPGLKRKIGSYNNFVTESGVSCDVAMLITKDFKEYVPQKNKKNIIDKEDRYGMPDQDIDRARLQINNMGVVSGDKERRFIRASRLKEDRTYEATMNIWNSYDNISCDFISVYEASPTVKIGVSVFNTLVIVIQDPQWNKASFEQIIARFNRIGGFEEYKNYLKRLNTEAGKTLYDPENIELHVYLLLARFERKDWTGYGFDGKTIDEKKKEAAENKQVLIDRIMNAMIERAVCRYLNEERNTDVILPPKQPVNPNDLKYDVFNNLYINNYVKYIKTVIVLYMENVAVCRIDEIITVYSYLRYPLTIYGNAITQLLQENTVVRNKFGIYQYIMYDKGTLYLSTIHPNKNIPSSSIDSYYSGKVCSIYYKRKTEHFNNIKEKLDGILGSEGDLKQNLLNSVTMVNGKDTQLPLPIFLREVLEFVLTEHIKGNKHYDKIMNIFSFYIYHFEKEKLHFHTFHAETSQGGKHYTLSSYLFNPVHFKSYGSDGKWHSVHMNNGIYESIKKYACNALKIRIRERLNNSLQLPIITYTIMDGRFRLVRRIPVVSESLIICGCDENGCRPTDSRLNSTGVLEIEKPDAIYSMYWINPTRRTNPWIQLEQIPANYLKLRFGDDVLVDTKEHIISALSYIMTADKKGSQISIDLLNIFVNKKKIISGYYNNLNWFGRIIANESFSHKGKSKTAHLTINCPDIGNTSQDDEILVYMYNWSSFYKSKSQKDVQFNLFEIAKTAKRLLEV